MSAKIQRNDPPYVQIAQQIRADIESGVLSEGDAIPSAREITARWGVALATATKVHARLRSEGLVQAIPGVGTVVAGGERGFGGSQRLQSSHKRGRIYGVDERAEIRSADLVEAPAEVTEALGLAPGSSAIRRERVTHRKGIPSSYSVSWFSAERADDAPKLLTRERIPEGTFAYAAAAMGESVASGREQTQAAVATTDDVETLGIPEDSPVLRSQTWFYTADGKVVEFGESVRGAGRWHSHDFSLK